MRFAHARLEVLDLLEAVRRDRERDSGVAEPPRVAGRAVDTRAGASCGTSSHSSSRSSLSGCGKATRRTRSGLAAATSCSSRYSSPAADEAGLELQLARDPRRAQEREHVGRLEDDGLPALAPPARAPRSRPRSAAARGRRGSPRTPPRRPATRGRRESAWRVARDGAHVGGRITRSRRGRASRRPGRSRDRGRGPRAGRRRGSRRRPGRAGLRSTGTAATTANPCRRSASATSSLTSRPSIARASARTAASGVRRRPGDGRRGRGRRRRRSSSSLGRFGARAREAVRR